MLKEKITNLKFKQIISASEFSIICELDDGRIFKRFTPIMLSLLACGKIDIESRINSAKPIKNVPEILIPISSVYEYGLFVGYTMTKAKGVMLSNNDIGATLEEVNDLDGITKRFLGLEDVVKRANEKGIVFPDFLTLENIFIDKEDNYQFIDYEGIQIGKDFVAQMSDGLGAQSQYYTPKYFQEPLFTSNLDKKSLIYYYFLDAFHLDLTKVNVPMFGHIVSLDEAFYRINLTDYDLQHKVWLAMQPTFDNEYIGDDVKRLAESYTLSSYPIGKDIYMKRLLKK